MMPSAPLGDAVQNKIEDIFKNTGSDDEVKSEKDF